ncbi:hypothetical protein ABI125_05290 [Tamlana crocina]
MKTINKQIRLAAVLTVFTLITTATFAQDNLNTETTIKRKGFIFEFTLGAGFIGIEDSQGTQTFDKFEGGISFPELKFGHMLNDNLAITVSMPGKIYEFQENDRHFGVFVPSVQYWIKDRWWIHGGIGLAVDGPALYDIKENVNDDWNFGGAVMASTGYEFYKKKNFAMNVQSKLVMGTAYLDGDAQRDAVTFSIGIGFSWF